MKLRIEYDQDCDSPCENDGQWKLYSFNSRHCNFKSPWDFLKHHCDEPIPCNIGFARKLEVGTAFILSCYEHSGSEWGLQGEVTQCCWDTTRVAGVLVWEHKPSDMGAKTYKERQEDARRFLKVYNEWANGQCFGYILETDDGDEVDSCWGFIGTDDLIAMLAESHPELFEADKKTLKVNIELEGEAQDALE